MSDSRGVALILAAGDGIGTALARRFAEGGYHVVPVRRSMDQVMSMQADIRASGGQCTGMTCDVRNEADVSKLFDNVEDGIGPIEVCIYNGGANTDVPLDKTSGELFRKVWELCTFGAFLATRESARVMRPRGRGVILYSGATSGIRGKAGYAAFSSAKFGLRSLAETAAKELGPAGIHAAHVLIDGGIDSEAIARLFRERADIDVATLDQDALIDPAALAEVYWQVSQQPRSCWTWEITVKSGATY